VRSNVAIFDEIATIRILKIVLALFDARDHEGDMRVGTLDKFVPFLGSRAEP
jgi:hypothetical protein